MYIFTIVLMLNIKPKVWSNFLFIIPAVTSLLFNNVTHAILILLTMVFSTMYHNTNEMKYHSADQFFAITLISYNFYYLYINQSSYFVWILLIPVVLMGFYYLWYKRKDDYEWHIACVIITQLVVMVNLIERYS